MRDVTQGWREIRVGRVQDAQPWENQLLLFCCAHSNARVYKPYWGENGHRITCDGWGLWTAGSLKSPPVQWQTLCVQRGMQKNWGNSSSSQIYRTSCFFFFGQCPHRAHLGTTLTSFKNSFPSSFTLLLRLEGSQTSSRFMWMKRTIWLSNQFFELCPSPTRRMLFTWTPHGLSEDSSARNELDRKNIFNCSLSKR